MSARDTYLVAQFPEQYRFRILGWRLAAFTLGHALLLQWAENPFVTGSRLPGRGDCAVMLAVCTRSFPKARRLLRSRWLTWRLRRYAVPERLLSRTIVMLCSYLEHFGASPQAWEDSGGGRTPATPIWETNKLNLMSRLGKSEQEALETPLSLAVHDVAGIRELRGELKLVSERDEQMMEIARQVAGKN